MKKGEEYIVLGTAWVGYCCGTGWMMWVGKEHKKSRIVNSWTVVDSAFFSAPEPSEPISEWVAKTMEEKNVPKITKGKLP